MLEIGAQVNTVVQPDVAVICAPGKLDDAGCRGAPDWIVEVLSPHTPAKDQSRKRELYQRHGFGEYWLVHPTDRVLTIYRLIEPGGLAPTYGAPAILTLVGETPVATLPGLHIHWPAPEQPAEPPAPHPREQQTD